MAVVVQRGDDGRGVIGLQRRQDRLVPRDAVARAVPARLFPEVHRHRELQFQQDRLERDVELPVVRQPDHGRVERAVRVVAFQLVGRGAHLVQRGANRLQRRRGIGERQRGLDRVTFQHMAQREELQDVRRATTRRRVNRGAGQVLDEPLLRQQPQRLPQRCPADAEVGAELLFDDLLSGAQRHR